jgi:hypothetical protein
MSAITTEKNLRIAIAKVISYGALYGVAYTDTEILQYLPVKASIVGLRNHLNRMIKRGVLQVDKAGRYKMKKISYPSQTIRVKNWQQIITSARTHTRLLRTVPFIKAIVVLPQSDERSIRIAVVALPARLHLARMLVEKFFAGRSLQNSQKRQIEVIDTLYFTTAGLRFVDDFGWSDLDRTICLLSAKPIHGTQVWQTMLQKNTFIRTASPNYIWPKMHTKVYASTLRRLDDYEDKTNRSFLRSMANKKEYRSGGALLRIRPDVIVADPYASRKSLLAQRFNQLIKKF